jgi:CelD/BcsL family acetyltransferase involved in cellulose biosynthesis
VRQLPVRALSLMDAPDTAFSDVPVARGLDEVLGRVLDLLRERRDWDVFRMPKLRADAGSAKLLQSLLASGSFPWRISAREQSPYISLSGTWENFFRTRSQRFRKTVRNVENRLERLGKITVEEHRQVDPDGPVFAELMDVAYRSWKGPRGLSIATMNGMQRFFRELTRRASPRNSLRLWVLRMDSRAIATEYQLIGANTVHALRADFDGALADASPGSYLNAAIVRSLFERQEALEYDMGPGTNEYKLRWATDTHDLISLEVYAPTAYGRFLHCLETRVVPTARKVSEQLSRRAAR